MVDLIGKSGSEHDVYYLFISHHKKDKTYHAFNIPDDIPVYAKRMRKKRRS